MDQKDIDRLADAIARIADSLDRIANQMERDGRSPLPSPVEPEPSRGDRWPLGPYTAPQPPPTETWRDWDRETTGKTPEWRLYSNDTDAEP